MCIHLCDAHTANLCERVNTETEKENSRTFQGHSYIFQGQHLIDSLHLILQSRVVIVVVINTSTSPDIMNSNMCHTSLRYENSVFFFFFFF